MSCVLSLALTGVLAFIGGIVLDALVLRRFIGKK